MFFHQAVDVFSAFFMMLFHSMCFVLFFVPFVFPCFGVYLWKNNKKIWGSISGKVVFVLSLILLGIYWIPLTRFGILGIGQWLYGEPVMSIRPDDINVKVSLILLLVFLVLSWAGTFVFLEKGIYLKAVGSLVFGIGLFSLLCFLFSVLPPFGPAG